VQIHDLAIHPREFLVGQGPTCRHGAPPFSRTRRMFATSDGENPIASACRTSRTRLIASAGYRR
jgi:hypothetical protein